MKIYLLYPQSVPPNPCLFPAFEKTWVDNGCTIVSKIQDCDIVFFDLHTRISDYKQDDIDYITKLNIPIVTFDEWDRGNMSKDEWPNPLTEQQKQIFNHIENTNIKAVHFCRLLDKTNLPNIKVYPYEKPISYQEPICTSDELFSRPYDIVYIANTAPSREAIANAIQQDGRLKCLTIIGGEKIPFNEFVNMHRQGKLFISSAAGGYTDERMQCLFSIAGMIKQSTNQLLLNEFTNGINCLKISDQPTEDELNFITKVVNNKERLYEIYKYGYDFIREFYTEEYFANYILKTIK